MKTRLLSIKRLLCLFVLASTWPCGAGLSTNVFNSFDRGWYFDDGTHNSANNNYFVQGFLAYYGGYYWEEYRNWFVFSIPSSLGLIQSATFRIYSTSSLYSDTGSEVYQLHEVTNTVSRLRGGGTGLVDVFSDLGDGPAYGSRTIFPSETNQFLTIPLNGAAITAITARKGSSIAVGGRLTTYSSSSSYGGNRGSAFGDSHTGNPSDGRVQLELVVENSPVIIAQPSDLTITNGGNGAFGEVAVGTGQLNYQWLFNGSSIPNATNASLTLSNATFANQGGYSVIVTNAYGSVTSAVAVLTVGGFLSDGTLIPSSDGHDGDYVPASSTMLAGGNYHFRDFIIPAGVTISVTGNDPLRVYCSRLANVMGTLTASGGNGGNGVAGDAPGGTAGSAVAGGGVGGGGGGRPGGFNNPGTNGYGPGGGFGMPFLAGVSIPGGGGGAGFASLGANGASGYCCTARCGSEVYTLGGPGGTAYSSNQFSVLLGGSGGGGGCASGADNGSGAGGGGGGGAILIEAPTLKVSGVIRCNGGNGGSVTDGSDGSAGGGGSGGSIWLRGIEVTNSGTIHALGGAGGTTVVGASCGLPGAGGNGSVGRVRRDGVRLADTGVMSPASFTTVLTSNMPPQIATQPQNQIVLQGNNAAFAVAVASSITGPFAYQWYFGGSAIIGATNASLTLSSVTFANQGGYSVIVTNASGSVTSAVATLSVKLSGITHWWPGNGSGTDLISGLNAAAGGSLAYGTGRNSQCFVLNGANAYLQVPAHASIQPGTGSVTLEGWFKLSALPSAGSVGHLFSFYDCGGNCDGSSWFDIYIHSNGQLRGVLRDAGDNSQQIVTSTGVTDAAWHHVVMVRDVANTQFQIYLDGVLSSNATLTVLGSIVDAGDPDPMTIGCARSSNTTSLSEFFNGALDDLAYYNRAVSASEVQQLYYADQPLYITGQPTNQTVQSGSNAVFSVTASGVSPFAYQWRFGNTPIPDATNASLTLSSATFANQGGYSVIVTNASGSVTSSVAYLNLDTTFSNNFMSFVSVGNPGNSNDATTGYGAVGYQYSIGKYEVTLNQYAAFLNAVASTDAYGLYNAAMATDLNIAGISRSGVSGSYSYTVIGDGNRPMSYVNWFDAARFANWLHNGRPSGAQTAATTEAGAYTLNGATSGTNFTKNASAQYWIPSEDEWYKAAYHQPASQGGDVDNYWLYPTANNATPNSRNGSSTDPNSANFYRDDGIANGYNGGYAVNNAQTMPAGNVLTPVGAYSLAGSYYGSFDQGGNVWEWNDSVIGNSRGLRGGAWNYDHILIQATYGNAYTVSPADELKNVGFRLAATAAPLIAHQPQSQTVGSGSNATFSVSTVGLSPFSYQWLFAGSPISGATNASLTLSSVTFASQGGYSVIVTNAFGSVTSSVATLTVMSSEMQVLGNGLAITDGDNSPEAANHTDFGPAAVGVGNVVRTFTITNMGNATLNLTGTPKVLISGSHAPEFTVTVQPASSIAAASSTTFQVTFAPAATGLRTATLSIANDDTDENPYDFAIQGTGTCPAIGLSPAALPIGTVGLAYNHSITASGGTGPYTFAVSSGTLPAGLVLSSAGILSGTPLASGASSFVVTATGSFGCTGSQPYSVEVLTVYSAPVANPDAFSTYRNVPVPISETALTSNDVAGIWNGSNTTLGVILVSATSSNGGTVLPQTGSPPLWTNRLDAGGSAEVYGAALGSGGKLFVTGMRWSNDSAYDFQTAAYSSTGTLLWTNSYSGPGSQSDYARALAVDASDNVFVTGYASGASGHYEFATLAYSSAGVPLWTNHYTSSATADNQPTAIAVASNGNVFVTGSSWDSGQRDMVTMAYSNSGVPLWTNSFNGPANDSDEALAIAVGNDGRVIVAGYSQGAGASNPDFTTIAYSNEGVSLWTNHFNGTGNDFARNVAVGADGTVFVTGQSWGAASGYDCATVAYSGNGVPLWTNRYDGQFGEEMPMGISVGSNGNVVVTGNSQGNGGPQDFVTLAYSAAGVPLWTNRYNGPADNHDSAMAVAQNASGNLFVTGYSYATNGTPDYLTIAYSAGGVPLWTNSYDGPISGDDTPNGIAVSSDGDVYVAGRSAGTNNYWDFTVIKYQGGGSGHWLYTPPVGYTGVDAFTYVIQDGWSLMATGTVTVTVYGPPEITVQPLSQTNHAGSNVTFTVMATGGQPLAYQWRKDGEPLFSSITNILEVTGLRVWDAGGYDVVVTNAYGSITSSVATLTVICPNITVNGTPPPSLLVGQGIMPLQFSAYSDSGAPNLTIFASGLPPGLGAFPSGSWLTVSGTPSVPGTYVIVVTAQDMFTGCSGSAVYTQAVVCPEITLAPSSLPQAAVGSNYNVAITATEFSGNPSPTFTYGLVQGALPAGVAISTGGQLSGAPTTFGMFDIVLSATNGYGCVVTNAYTLTVASPPPPTISQPPKVEHGNFTVGFAGVPNVSYAIEYLTNLGQGTWQNFTNVTASPTGEIVFTAPVTAAPARFFRAVPAP